MNQWGSRPPITMTTLKESAMGNPGNDRRIGGGAAKGDQKIPYDPIVVRMVRSLKAEGC
jgi:hypothetical protein